MKTAVVVDPFSTGKLLAAEFAKHGVETVAVLTQPIEEHYSAASFTPAGFARVFTFSCDSYQRLIDDLKRYDPVCVVPGCESGVLLADDLCTKLDLHANDQASAIARRDKFEMQERVGNAGLRSIRQFKAGDLASACAWAKEHDQWPVVAKPLRSAASDNVWLCPDLETLRRRIDAIQSSTTITGEQNTEVLLQEYVQGTEYVVDAVSVGGHAYLTNACRYVKETTDGAFVYREVHVLSAADEEITPLLEYHAGVLRALGIRFGASHMEIMMTATGPVLIECGARLHGGVTVPSLVEHCCSVSPVEALVRSYLEPQSISEVCARMSRFGRRAAVFVLANAFAGRVASLAGLESLKKLPSFSSVQVNVKTGDPVRKTTDLYSSPAWVALESSSAVTIRQDISFLRDQEASGRLIAIESQV